MSDRTDNKLIRELEALRKRVSELEQSGAAHQGTAEQARASENTYRILFENATDAIYLIDPESQKILDCNSKASKMIGYSAKQLRSMTVRELHPDEEQDVVLKIFRKVAERGSLSGIVGVNQLNKDKELVPVEINAATVEIGNKQYCLSIVRDITEHKKAEERLRYEKNKLVSILDSMEDGVYIANQQYDIEYVNPVLKKEFGAVRGRKCHMYFHNREDACPWCKNREFLAGKSIRWEWHSEKNNKIYDLIDTPLKNPDGSTSKLEIFRDITDRKKTEERLVMSEKRWEATFDTIPDLILVIDNQHKILKANRAIAEKMGVKREDLIGRPCHDVMHGTETPPPHCPHSKTMEDGKEHIREIYEEKFRGFYIVSSSPVYDAEGRPLGIVEVARDITKRRKMEEQLRTEAMTDELTGLFNRRGFFTLSEKHCKLANRTGRRMSLMYLDINDMKAINDKLGHAAGDQALKDTGKILKASFRESDIIARIGGDEFAVLFTEHSESDIEDTVNANITKNLDTHNSQGLRNYELSFSTGIVYYDPEHPCSMDNLLTRADGVMYDAKRHHKPDRVSASLPSNKTTESRIYKRFRTGDNCWAEIDGTGKVLIKDISINGICLKTPAYLNTRTVCDINVYSEHESILSKGMVVWSYLIGTETAQETSLPYYETGMKFIEVDEATKNSLKKYIAALSG